METTDAIQRRIATAQELHSIVRTMKTLSSTSIRQFERAAASVGRYAHTVELGFRAILRDTDVGAASGDEAQSGPVGVLAFGSDRGFCGRFNRDIAEEVLAWLAQAAIREEDLRLAALGGRLAVELELNGLAPDVREQMPGTVESISDSVQHLLTHLDAWQREGGVQRVMMFRHRPLERHGHRIVTAQLMPLDVAWLRSLIARPWPTRVIPWTAMDRRELLTALTRQHVFATLYAAIAESLASEHAVRLQAMRSAEQTIEDRLDELESRYNEVRQAVITEELLDVTAGFEALERAALGS